MSKAAGDDMRTPVGVRAPTPEEIRRDRVRVLKEREWQRARADAGRRARRDGEGPGAARVDWNVVGGFAVLVVVVVGAGAVVWGLFSLRGALFGSGHAATEREAAEGRSEPPTVPRFDARSLPTPAVPTAPPPKVEVVSADALGRAYRDNEVAADRQYEDHRLLVVGTVGDIGKTFGSTYVTLYTSLGCANISCNLSRHEDWVATLKKGQQVWISGVCYGLTLGTVSLDECHPVPSEK